MSDALAAPEIWPLSIAAYRTLGDAGLVPKNTELLYGAVYRKMSKSPLHSTLVRRLIKLLSRIELPGRFVMSEQPITCIDSEPEPDVAVIRGHNEQFTSEHPSTAELVIEVSVSSLDYDRFKLRAYAQAGVKEVWLALAAEKQIEIYHYAGAGQFSPPQVRGPGGSVASAAVSEFTLELAAFFDPSVQGILE